MRPMAKNKFHDGHGPSQRQLRVGELIRRTLSDILMRGDVHDPELNRLSQDDLIALMARNKGELRRIIGRKLDLKYAPDLRFRLDPTFDQMDETRRLFAQDDVRRDLDD